MAAIVKCDCCGAVVPHNKAVHVRFHKMLSATRYDCSAALETCEMCSTCYKAITKHIKKVM